MRVFVADGSGAIRRRLVPQLVARGHQVTATTTNAAKLDLIRQWGADAEVMDGLDAAAVGEAVASAQPDVIVHQMTAFSGVTSFRSMKKLAPVINRLRAEGADHLVAAAHAIGGAHVIAQSHASFNGAHTGGWVKTEDDPLEAGSTPSSRAAAESLLHVEDVVTSAGGAVLRYGAFYGPGATSDIVRFVNKRQFPLVGDGAGHLSWVNIDDAADATVLAVEQRATGVFNIVDDDPAPVREWLPHLAACAGAKPPRRVPTWVARLLSGDAVAMMTEGRGFSNAKAKKELGWDLRYPSWRQGFEEALT